MRYSTMRYLWIVLAGLATLGSTVPAAAYSWRTCNGINLRLLSNKLDTFASATSFPTGYWRDGLQNAVNQFNRNPSNLFYVLNTDTNGVALGNGQSEVWGTTTAAVLQGAPAIAYSYWQCFWTPFTGTVAYMTEGDVAFDYNATAANPFEWTMTRNKTLLIGYTGTSRLLQGTAVHEFGHAAGLLHENRQYNVMGADFTHVHTNGVTTNAYIGEDTGAGTVLLYGLWAAGPLDLGVQHWKYAFASGEYSMHTRTQLFNTAGSPITGANVPGEKTYRVRRGQVVSAEFTYENNGRDTVTNVPLRYYISTDDLITTADLPIASASISTLARDSVLTARVTLVIPTSLTTGRNYWLGVIVNPNNTILDGYAYNNATYIPIRVAQ